MRPNPSTRIQADRTSRTDQVPVREVRREAPYEVQHDYPTQYVDATEDHEQLPGGDDERLLGRYQLKKQLGSGAFGTVWLARDERLDRDVAVKSLPRDQVVHQRFEREARAAARLQHPAIVTLYEAAVDDDGAYLVSELVRGKTLDALLDAGKLSDHDIVEIGMALTQALAHAHEHGVIHRDVKPSNILVPNRVASGVRAKLTDFGVAQIVGSGSKLTYTGDVIGTLAYMSPEQAEGHEVTAAADLYALALVLYEALTGVNPLYQRNIFGRGRQRTPFIPPLRRQRRDLPKPLAAGIDRALSDHPADRGTLGDLYDALEWSLRDVDDTPGIVAPGWHGDEEQTAVRHEPGSEWSEHSKPGATARGAGRHEDDDWAARPVRDLDAEQDGRRLYRRAPVTRESLPDWLPRAASAAAAGVAAALLCTHLLRTPPLAPASTGLLVAAATLLFPRLATTAAVVAFAALAVEQHHTGAGLLLAAVALPPILLTWLKGEVLALPAAAPLLGLLGLAGAFPALAGRAAFSWWQRAIFGAAGYVWTLYASALIAKTLYWWPARVTGAQAIAAAQGRPPGTPPNPHAWIGSAHATYDVLVTPLIHATGLAGAAVWALAAVLLPLIRTRRWPLLDLLSAGLWSVATVVAVGAVGAERLHDAVLGAVLGFVIAAWPAMTALTRGLRYGAGV